MNAWCRDEHHWNHVIEHVTHIISNIIEINYWFSLVHGIWIRDVVMTHISPISSVNQLPTSLCLFVHVPLKRDQWARDFMSLFNGTWPRANGSVRGKRRSFSPGAAARHPEVRFHPEASWSEFLPRDAIFRLFLGPRVWDSEILALWNLSSLPGGHDTAQNATNPRKNTKISKIGGSSHWQSSNASI